jgi:hypothetical protein
MLKPHRDTLAWIVLGAACLLLPACYILASAMEANAYNRVTGAHVTTWDAMWLDLRVTTPAE